MLKKVGSLPCFSPCLILLALDFCLLELNVALAEVLCATASNDFDRSSANKPSNKPNITGGVEGLVGEWE